MKKVLFAIFLICSCGMAIGAEFPISPKFKLPKHPRILLQRGEEKQLMKDISKDSLWTAIHQEFLSEADKYVEQAPIKRELEGRRMLGTSRKALRKIFICSYAYRTTKDKKYMEEVREELLNVCSYEDWHPSHFLDTGEMTLAVAIGLDWTWNDLTSKERDLISDAVFNLGIAPSNDNTKQKDLWWIKANNNWGQVCHAGLSLGAIAAWERNREVAAETVNRAIQNVPIAMAAYAPDGAYPEGSGYWDYGTTFNVLLLDELKQAFQSDFELSKAQGFMQTGQYVTHMCTPNINNFAYSDNGTGIGISPASFWFLRETGDQNIFVTQQKILNKKGIRSLTNDRISPMAIIWGREYRLSENENPTSLCYSAEGDNPVFTTRSSWDYKAAFLGVKAGSPSTNHAHMDEGSFFYESNGIQWATDLGTENYNNLEQAGLGIWNGSQNSERWSVYRYSNLNHNTLTFDGERQIVKGKTTFLDMKKDFPGMAKMDLTPNYSNKAKVIRTCSLHAIDDLSIEDDIEPIVNTELGWTLMTRAKVEKLNAYQLKLSQDNYEMILSVSGIKTLQWTIEDAIPSRACESKNPGVTRIHFTTPLSKGEKVNLKVSLKGKSALQKIFE